MESTLFFLYWMMTDVWSLCYPTDVCVAWGDSEGTSSHWYTCENGQVYYEVFDNDMCDDTPITSQRSSAAGVSCDFKCEAYVIVREYASGEDCSKEDEWFDTMYPTGCNSRHGISIECTNEIVITKHFTGTKCITSEIWQQSRLYPGCPGIQKFSLGGELAEEPSTEILHCDAKCFSIKIPMLIGWISIIFNS
eukprot:187126_1